MDSNAEIIDCYYLYSVSLTSHKSYNILGDLLKTSQKDMVFTLLKPRTALVDSLSLGQQLKNTQVFIFDRLEFTFYEDLSS